MSNPENHNHLQQFVEGKTHAKFGVILAIAIETWERKEVLRRFRLKTMAPEAHQCPTLNT